MIRPTIHHLFALIFLALPACMIAPSDPEPPEDPALAATLVLKTAAGELAGCGAVRVAPKTALTALHCIQGPVMAAATWGDVAWADGNAELANSALGIVVGTDPDRDLAWLALETEGPFAVVAEHVEPGAVVVSWHHTGMVPYQRTRGAYMGEVDDLFRTYTIDIFKGASGCGVFTAAGELLGVWARASLTLPRRAHAAQLTGADAR